jgi:hypothetical protein
VLSCFLKVVTENSFFGEIMFERHFFSSSLMPLLTSISSLNFFLELNDCLRFFFFSLLSEKASVSYTSLAA